MIIVVIIVIPSSSSPSYHLSLVRSSSHHHGGGGVVYGQACDCTGFPFNAHPLQQPARTVDSRLPPRLQRALRCPLRQDHIHKHTLIVACGIPLPRTTRVPPYPLTVQVFSMRRRRSQTLSCRGRCQYYRNPTPFGDNRGKVRLG